MSTYTIITPSLVEFGNELQTAVLAGYRIDPNNPPSNWGIYYECILIKDDVVPDGIVFVKPEQAVVSEHVVVTQPAKKAGRPAKVVQ